MIDLFRSRPGVLAHLADDVREVLHDISVRLVGQTGVGAEQDRVAGRLRRQLPQLPRMLGGRLRVKLQEQVHQGSVLDFLVRRQVALRTRVR
jgi:hypothetical protein